AEIPGHGMGGPTGDYGQNAADFTNAQADLTPRMPIRLGVSRAKMAREARRVQQFAKFRNVSLNLVPLVDTLVSVVFFAPTAATARCATTCSRGSCRRRGSPASGTSLSRSGTRTRTGPRPRRRPDMATPVINPGPERPRPRELDTTFTRNLRYEFASEEGRAL